MMQFVGAFILLLVIMDPALIATSFMSLAKDKKLPEMRSIALKAFLVAAPPP